MNDASPQLVSRIVRALARARAPRSCADLAREFLGVGLIEEGLAAALLDPALRLDPRLVKDERGWQLASHEGRVASPLLLKAAPLMSLGTPSLPSKLTNSFQAALAPSGVEGCAAITRGPDSPRFSVLVNGEREAVEYERRAGVGLAHPVWSLAECARRLRGFRGRADPISLAERLGAPHVEGDTLTSGAEAIAATWEHLSAELALEGIVTIRQLKTLLTLRLERADFTQKRFSEQELLTLPEAPGVYIFRAFDRRVLYVGQSSHLRSRVCSYFSGAPRDAKDRALREQASELEIRPLDTGLDALIAEARAIRALAPTFNTRRNVRKIPHDDGVLMVPATRNDCPARSVLFTLAGGLLCRRLVAGTREGQRRRAAQRAVEALIAPPAVPLRRAEDAALAATWLRLHPRCPFLRLGIDGDAEALVEKLVRAAKEER